MLRVQRVHYARSCELATNGIRDDCYEQHREHDTRCKQWHMRPIAHETRAAVARNQAKDPQREQAASENEKGDHGVPDTSGTVW